MTVKDVLTLPLDILECFTWVTTRDVESYINAFQQSVAKSNDLADKEAGNKLVLAYKGYYELLEEINSDSVTEAIQLAASVNLADISYNSDDIELANIKTKFNCVLDGESKLMKRDKENFENTINYMVELAENTGSKEILNTTKNVVKNMKMMSNIFINKNGEIIQSSRLVSALKFKEKMVTLLAAIDDVTILKNKGQGNVDPRTWRCF
jgi:hypothetical protein